MNIQNITCFVLLKWFVLGAIITLALSSCDQDPPDLNRLTDKYCNCIEKSKVLNDSARVMSCYHKNIVEKLEHIEDSYRYYEMLTDVELKIMTECSLHNELANSIDQGDWKYIRKKPETNLTPDQCLRFKQIEQFFYLESNGDTTILIMTGDQWRDFFSDGSQSVLDLNWTGTCEFEITFVASTNKIRNKMFSPGDKLEFRIIDVREEYYRMASSYLGRTYEFKLYY